MIAIKNMQELPDKCVDCPCRNVSDESCQADEQARRSEWRPFWCPLGEVTPVINSPLPDQAPITPYIPQVWYEHSPSNERWWEHQYVTTCNAANDITTREKGKNKND